MADVEDALEFAIERAWSRIPDFPVECVTRRRVEVPSRAVPAGAHSRAKVSSGPGY